MDYINAGVIVYLVAMLLFGWWGKSRTRNFSDYLRRRPQARPFLYTGPMAAVVLGGASAVGGVGLGYKFGIYGAWWRSPSASASCCSACSSHPALQRLKIYTVSQMLTSSYGSRNATNTSGIVIQRLHADALRHLHQRLTTIFVVLFGWEHCGRRPSVGGAIVLVSSTVALALDLAAQQVQFVVDRRRVLLVLHSSRSPRWALRRRPSMPPSSQVGHTSSPCQAIIIFCVHLLWSCF